MITMTKMNLPAILLAIVALCTGCMSTKLVAKYDSDSIVHHQATKITYLWGAMPAKDIPAECDSKAICQVKTQTNFGFICVSFLTLGVVVPQKLVWDCCGEPIKEEPFK